MSHFSSRYLLALSLFGTSSLTAEPLVDSWLTSHSTKYARVYETVDDRNNDTTVTTWTDQNSPAYADIQAIYSSSNWTYVRYSGLSSHTMGPWLRPDGGQFQFWPENQKGIHRFPRTPQEQAGTKDQTRGGHSGLFVNGVALYGPSDGQAWDGSQIQSSGSQTSDAYFWHRNAPVAEGFNFDTGLGHQPPTGVYHTHQNPIALRFQLGDHVEENPAFTTDSDSWDFYQEKSTTPVNHSPIIGWSHDGYPIYGPYGYDNPDPASTDTTLRRMVSGYHVRNGQNGTDRLNQNLDVIPIWYAKYREAHFGENYGSYSVAERTVAVTRPSVGSQSAYPRETFAQDFEFLGDLNGWSQHDGSSTFSSSSHYDLDRYNGRFCRTPEFPDGTYAYFTALDENLESTFPYLLGFEYYGDATGGSVNNITETVTTEFIGGPHADLNLQEPELDSGTVTLTWNSVEGGTYQIESSDQESTGFSVEKSSITGTGDDLTDNYTDPDGNGFAKVTRTALASFDDVFTTAPGSTQTDTEAYVTVSTDPILYVNADRTGQPNQDGQSWDTAFADLQDAIASATSGDEIWVAAGIYYPDEAEAGIATVTANDEYSRFGLVSGVSIYGGFAGGETQRTQRDYQTNLTILSGDIDQNDTSTNGVVLDDPFSNILGTNARSVINGGSDLSGYLDGVIVTAGRGGEAGGISGGGSYRHCTFQGNLGITAGARSGEDEVFRFVQCDFINNQGSSAGAVSCFGVGEAVTIISCRFLGNRAISTGSSNSAGAIMAGNGTLQLTNCLFAGNAGVRHGAIHNRDGGTLRIDNSTIAHNLASGSDTSGSESGGIGAEVLSVLDLDNTLVWGNEQNGSPSNITGNFNMQQSLVEGDASGKLDGTDSANDPLFLNPIPASSAPTSTGDYRLPGHSPCIDSGDSIETPSDLTDLDDDGVTNENIPYDLQGNPRLTGEETDIGAYEYAGPLPLSTSITLSLEIGDSGNSLSLDLDTLFASSGLSYTLVAITPSQSLVHTLVASDFTASPTEDSNPGESAQVTILATDANGDQVEFTFTVEFTEPVPAPTDSLSRNLASWHTETSGQYARLYTSLAAMNSQNPVTTWSRGAGEQDKPTYAGVHEVSYTDTDIYVRATNLPFHTMGPWFLDEAKTQAFGNYPSNQADIYRFPRIATIPEVKSKTTPGAIGKFVDGVNMFDSTDTFSYDTSSGQDQTPGAQGVQGDGIWNRDAFVNESVTFDNANAHQAGSDHHYHANPPGLRHVLGDSVDHDPTTNTYTENFNGSHSPIIGWCRDGLPIYGPYGYGIALDPESPVRLMVSGYQKRDGSNGSTNLATAGRTTLPLWVVRNNPDFSSINLAASQYGPDTDDEVETGELAEIGRYLEDYAYKGDLGLTQGIEFDLNEYNVRWCVTPEFPNGTWAYFTCIEPDGTPAFPYNISQYYFGSPSGAEVTSVPATATVAWEGGPEATAKIQSLAFDDSSGDVTLVWQGIEGGYHQIERSEDLSDENGWTDLEAEARTSNGINGESTDGSRTNLSTRHFYRLQLTEVDDFDDTGFVHSIAIRGGGGGTGGGGTVQFAFSFGTTPPLPPQGAIDSANVGGQAATIISYDQGSGNVTLSFDPSSLTGPSAAQLSFTPPGGSTQTRSSTNSYTP